MTPAPDADAQATALALWLRRHHLSAQDQAIIEALPDPYRAAFAANAARRAGRRDEALELADRGLAHAVDHSLWRGHLLRLQAAVLADLRLTDQAVALNTAAQDCARATGDDLSLASCLQDLATYPHQPEARMDALLSEARELAHGVGAQDLVVLIDYNRALWHAESGVPADDVIAALQSVEERSRGVWPDLADEALARQVTVAARAGDLARARDLARALPDEAGIVDEETLTSVACARAWVLADDGRTDEAHAALTRWLGTVTEERRVDLLTTLTDVLAHAGRYAAAWRASQDLVRAVRDNAESLGSAQARALEVWYGTRLALEARSREQARADELERALDELREAHAQIRELSRRDHLTGLHNRGYLLDAGGQAMRDAGPDTPVQVALVDIDSFKKVNDRYGHRVGDRVLQALATVARAALDDDDLVARYGGEEFVVLRPAGVRSGRDLADDLTCTARRLKALDLTGPDSDGPHGVTLSGGLVHATGGTLEQALHDADLLMYAAKHAGGDALRTDRDQ